MEDDVKSIGDYISIAWRRKYFLIVPVILLSIATVVVVKLLPPVYRSTGTILVESQQIPEEFIQSTVTGYADQRIQIIQQRIMTSRQIMAIVDKYDLVDKEFAQASRSDIVESIRQRIFVDRIREGYSHSSGVIAFNVSFEDQSAEKAQQVANELVTLFMDQNLKARKEVAGETSDFLRSEADRLAGEIAAMEESIARYQEENKGRLPENMVINLGRVEELRARLVEVERERTNLNNNRILLQIELDSTPRNAPLASAEGDEISLEAELIRLQNEFVSLSSRYGVEHPDVKALKREIAAFEQEYGRSVDQDRVRTQISEVEQQLADARQRYTEEHPDIKRLLRTLDGLKQIADQPEVTATPSEDRLNPAYLRLTARLEAIDNSLESMAATRREIEGEIAQLNVLIRQIPQVQRGLDALLRDYENTRTRYGEVKANQLQAEMSMSLEENQKGERFTLLEPPLLPETPIKPKRTKLALLGLLLSLFAGVGVVVLVESLDRGIYGSRNLAKVTKSMPLVSIPYIVTRQDTKRQQRNIQLGIATVVFICILGVVLLHFLYAPLDIVWLKLAKALNIS